MPIIRIYNTEDYVHIMVPSQYMAYKSVSHYEYENHDLYNKEERNLNILYNDLAIKNLTI